MKNFLLLLLFIPFFCQSQEDVKVDLSNPNATIYTHFYFLQSSSYHPEKAAKTINGLPKDEAIEKAIKLKRILDGKGLKIDFNKIPYNPNYNDSIGYSANHKFILFPNRMPQIYVEKVGDNWYYSPETVRSIDALHAEIYPWYVQSLQKIIPVFGHKKFLGIEFWQIMALIILLIVAFIFFFVFKKVTFFVLQKIQYKITHTKSIMINKVIKKLAHPVGLLIAITVIEKIIPSLELSINANRLIFLFLEIVATVFWIYIFLKLVQVVMKIYAELTQRTHGKLDDQLVPVLDNFLRGIVIFLGLLKFLMLFGVNPTTVIAGASIGGLAVALASQDTVKNLIGTLMIFLDKPFHIDDWIEAGEVVGTVEEVGFRSTRVRAADTSIYQIPNSKLAEITINNKGLRLFRRYTTTLGIRYDTPPELIEAFVTGIKQIVIAHPETRSESYNVEFTDFGDSALKIMVNVYFKSLEWGEEQSSRHRLHMAIVKLAKALGVEFAFPSTTVFIEQFPQRKSTDMNYDSDAERMNAAISKTVDEFNQNLPKEENGH